MSFQIKNATFVNKKVTPQNVNFEVNKSEVATVIGAEDKTLRHFKNILMGRNLVKNGVFKIDGFDKVNAQWTRRKVALIDSRNSLIRRWPEKFWLYWSLLLNKNFYSEAKINYINSKYSYLSFVTSKNNQSDLDMRAKVESMVEQFIESSVAIEMQWLDEFLDKMVTFNDNKLQEKYGNIEEHIRIIVKDYYYLIEKNANLEFLQTFLQSLWDKVYSFIDLNSLCTCEYNARKSKNRETRKKAKELKFTQQNFVIRKQLKIIDLKIANIKRKISKNKFIIKNLSKQIIFELKKTDAKKFKRLKEIDELFKWRQLAKDQRFEFKQKQDNMAFEALADEATIIRGKIVEVMHKYHKEVLEGKVFEGDLKTFRITKQEYKDNIKTINAQAWDWINKTVEDLGMKMNFVKTTFKVSVTNNIYFKILNSIYLKKYNFVFYNILSRLSKEECEELFNIVENLKSINPKFSAVFLEKGIENSYRLSKNIYVVDEEKTYETDFESLMKENWNTYGSSIFANKNRVAYSYDGKTVEVLGQKVKLENTRLDEKGQFLINPFKIYLSKKELKGKYIELTGKIRQTEEFKDPNIFEIILNSGVRIFFYTTLRFEHKARTTIYLSEDSILRTI
ncbi:hypothetical protein SCHIN_v1c11820 [Spiroplasma chinense]|uniref:Uncharacterized protein n=1 Tax=Spiroplasma chinense TaxID=216932 RepID=A0A5B9Y696_9MOLU|nr:hypothetical protein [Spiroplasma chinense]QEH62375.1 hypothetical protein SCHIN_v1c11820 [Spiroplasma chinense]